MSYSAFGVRSEDWKFYFRASAAYRYLSFYFSQRALLIRIQNTTSGLEIGTSA